MKRLKPLEIFKKNALKFDPSEGIKMTEEHWQDMETRGKDYLTLIEQTMTEFSDQEKAAFITWYLQNKTKYANPSPDFLLQKFNETQL